MHDVVRIECEKEGILFASTAPLLAELTIAACVRCAACVSKSQMVEEEELALKY